MKIFGLHQTRRFLFERKITNILSIVLEKFRNCPRFSKKCNCIETLNFGFWRPFFATFFHCTFFMNNLNIYFVNIQLQSKLRKERSFFSTSMTGAHFSKRFKWLLWNFGLNSWKNEFAFPKLFFLPQPYRKKSWASSDYFFRATSWGAILWRI